MSEKLNAISEVSYLSAPSALHYRTIMRNMFLANESVRYMLYKEEIYDMVVRDDNMSGYTMDDLKLDLDQLVSWGNLNAVQDPGTVHTIAEYKNRKFRYSMTEKAVEIERMTIRLENIHVESSTLSAGYFLRIEEALDQIPSLKSRPLSQVNEWWKDLQENFRRMNNNYNDYLRTFYTADTMRLMKSVDFLLHKEQFVVYLEEFISQIQLHAGKIRKKLQNTQEDFDTWLLQRIFESEMDIPYLKEAERDEKQIETVIHNSYASLRRWFVDSSYQQAEYKKILEITDQIIRNIIEQAAMIAGMSNYGVSRKDDYKHYMKMFAQCENIDEAHCLSAHVFGAMHMQHFRLLHPDESDRINRSAYEMEHDVIELASASRTYRQRREKQGFEDKTMEKQMRRNEYIEKINAENEYLMKFVRNRILDVSKITETLPEFARQVLLKWIAAANMNESKTGLTESGIHYHLIRKEETCVLKCEDGNLHMPVYILEFENEQSE